MFFEQKHSLNEKEFFLSDSTNLTFAAHIHKAFEIFFQRQGVTDIWIDDKLYTLKAGQAVLIFPFQKHAYKCVEEGLLRLCLFSPDMVQDFYNAQKLPVDSAFDYEFSAKIPNDYLSQKAFVYSVLSAFEKDRIYTARGKGLDLLLKILLITENKYFSSDCTLRNIAREICYDYAYISKFFKKMTGVAFNQYVNALRINKSKQELLHSNKSITEISVFCGFDSLRTFNRAFLKFEGMNPTTFRRSAVK